jgi:hypothetical protein
VRKREEERENVITVDWFSSQAFRGSFRLVCPCQPGPIDITRLTLKAGRSSRAGHAEPLSLVEWVRTVWALSSGFDVTDNRSENVEVKDLGTSGSGEHDCKISMSYDTIGGSLRQMVKRLLKTNHIGIQYRMARRPKDSARFKDPKTT